MFNFFKTKDSVELEWSLYGALLGSSKIKETLVELFRYESGWEQDGSIEKSDVYTGKWEAVLISKYDQINYTSQLTLDELKESVDRLKREFPYNVSLHDIAISRYGNYKRKFEYYRDLNFELIDKGETDESEKYARWNLVDNPQEFIGFVYRVRFIKEKTLFGIIVDNLNYRLTIVGPKYLVERCFKIFKSKVTPSSLKNKGDIADSIYRGVVYINQITPCINLASWREDGLSYREWVNKIINFDVNLMRVDEIDPKDVDENLLLRMQIYHSIKKPSLSLIHHELFDSYVAPKRPNPDPDAVKKIALLLGDNKNDAEYDDIDASQKHASVRLDKFSLSLEGLKDLLEKLPPDPLFPDTFVYLHPYWEGTFREGELGIPSGADAAVFVERLQNEFVRSLLRTRDPRIGIVNFSKNVGEIWFKWAYEDELYGFHEVCSVVWSYGGNRINWKLICSGYGTDDFINGLAGQMSLERAVLLKDTRPNATIDSVEAPEGFRSFLISHIFNAHKICQEWINSSPKRGSLLITPLRNQDEDE